MSRTLLVLSACLFASVAHAGEPRARDLGVPFDGTPGPLNAIPDVPGVTVGQVTLIEDLADGRKVRTGVTAILPRGRGTLDTPSYGAWFPLNGNGEMTGTAWLEESGNLEGPVMLTNTHSVGVVRDAVIAWRVRAGGADASGSWWSLPVVFTRFLLVLLHQFSFGGLSNKSHFCFFACLLVCLGFCFIIFCLF